MTKTGATISFSPSFGYDLCARRLRTGESVRAVKDRLGIVLANGALFSLVMKLPFFGVMFGPALAAIGASIALVEHEQRNAVSASPWPVPAA